MKTIKKILVPVTFRGDFQLIFRKAVEIARYAKAELLLLHVYAHPLVYDNKTRKLGQRFIMCMERSKLRRLERMLRIRFYNLLESVPEANEVKVSFIKEKGIVVEKIRKVARQVNADLIIMGTKGRHGFEEYWGTKSSELISKINIPLLTVPYNAKETRPVKVAIAYDMKPLKNLENLNIVKVFLELYDAEVHIINVSENSGSHSKIANANLKLLETEFEGYNTIVHSIKDHDIERGINNYIAMQNISLVAVMHKPRGFFRSLFHESISRKMTFHSKVPILTLEEGK